MRGVSLQPNSSCRRTASTGGWPIEYWISDAVAGRDFNAFGALFVEQTVQRVMQPRLEKRRRRVVIQFLDASLPLLQFSVRISSGSKAAATGARAWPAGADRIVRKKRGGGFDQPSSFRCSMLEGLRENRPGLVGVNGGVAVFAQHESRYVTVPRPTTRCCLCGSKTSDRCLRI